MNALVRFQHSSIQIPSNYRAASRVLLVPGSGIAYSGEGVLVLNPPVLSLYTPKGLEKTIHFRSVIRAQEREFKGLTLEFVDHDGDTVLINPNENFGIEIRYKELGNFEDSLSVLTFYANHAREWADTLNQAVREYHHEEYKNHQIQRPT